MITDSVEEIKNKLDIKDVINGYIKLEKSGVNYRAVCPFHKEKTPSFFVSPTRQIWRCFGCGEGGDMFTFVEKIEGIEFKEALHILAQKAGVTLQRYDTQSHNKKNVGLEIYKLAAKYFHYQLESKNGNFVLEYLLKRGISQDSISTFYLGYAPFSSKSLIELLLSKGYKLQDIEEAGLAFRSRQGEHINRYRGRIIFPVFDINGNIVAFGARKLPETVTKKMKRQYEEDSAKYINSPQTYLYDKSKILYGLDKAKIFIRQEDTCIVVEGYTDVILAYQNECKNVVAASGTALTERQLTLLGRFTNNLITAFDMDIAGDSATRRGIDLAQNMGFNVKVVILDEGLDPADIILKDTKAWMGAVNNAYSIMQFYINTAFKKYDASTPEGKREIGKICTRVLANVSSQIEKAHWVSELALKLRVPEENVWQELMKVQKINGEVDISPQIIKEHVSKTNFSRKELIAQHILLHILKDPKLFSYIKNDLSIYKNTRVFDIFQTVANLKSKLALKSILSKLDLEKKNFVSQILFELEVDSSKEWSEATFNRALKEYKKLVLDEELNSIEIEIKVNEADGKRGKNRTLLKSFHEKALERANLL